MEQKLSLCEGCDLKCFNLSNLNNSEIDLLNKSKKELTFRKGETIMKQGAFINEIPFICNGLIKLERRDENGREMVIDFVSEGTNLGFSLIDAEEALFNMIALKDTKICMIKSTSLKYLTQTNSYFASIVLSWYRKNNVRQFNRLYILGAKQMHGRLAAMLLHLTGPEFIETDIFEWITRKDLANLAGMSIERMNHILSELKNDGLIEPVGKGFKILNHQKMGQLIRYS